VGVGGFEYRTSSEPPTWDEPSTWEASSTAAAVCSNPHLSLGEEGGCFLPLKSRASIVDVAVTDTTR
jgi:hypothetical protein